MRSDKIRATSTRRECEGFLEEGHVGDAGGRQEDCAVGIEERQGQGEQGDESAGEEGKDEGGEEEEGRGQRNG